MTHKAESRTVRIRKSEFSRGSEEFFRLDGDPRQSINMIHDVRDEEREMLLTWRKETNRILMGKPDRASFTEEEKAVIAGRLKMLDISPKRSPVIPEQ